MGTLVQPTRYDPYVLRNWLPEPETFHPDWVYWKQRSTTVQAVLDPHRSDKNTYTDPDAHQRPRSPLTPTDRSLAALRALLG